MRPLPPAALLLLALSAPGAALPAQEAPLLAGSEGVPVPKKTKHVQPAYPQEAASQGIRGIVILDLVLDTQGKVESTNVIRSVPGLDAAAIAAAQQWLYEPARVDGKPVRVRITVPVVFSLPLPALGRQAGVPELRQGVAPVWPAGASSGGLTTAEVTLEPDGRVGGAQVVEGGAPWSDALLAALRTWRFTPPPEEAVLSFRVEAEFVAARGSEAAKINLRAGGLQRSDVLTGSAPTPSPAAPPAAPPAGSPPAAAPATNTAAAAAPAQPPGTSSAPAPPAPAAVPATPPPAPVPPATVPPSTPVPGAAAPAGSAPAAATPAPATQAPSRAPAPLPATPPPPQPAPTTAPPPPVEVITAPPPPVPAENGVSAVRDVVLEPGVPDLARGRRPTTPPMARMAGATGAVEVTFSVSAGGATSVQASKGADLLRPAAEQAVASWVFRRTRADRAYLVAVFTYGQDRGAAVVRPQAAPAEPGTPAAPAAPLP
jgi:TonB family protein